MLTKEDFVAIVRYLVELHEGRGHVDDIDHLGNRRIRSVGELIANQFSVGLSRMARLVKERMSINTDPEKISLDDLVNARTVSAVIQAFFGSSQLSQFMDQTNPLAELTHKRRLSALGPGGLTRERAGFEVRDVHYSQYGRMCPIETPEGPNIGLITSLACYARVNDLGFVETPYRVVQERQGDRRDRVARRQQGRGRDHRAGQRAARIADGTFVDELVLCRQQGDVPLTPPDRIDYMDVAPEQLVSIAAALIPFLEHDDANRALMGSNMQRQAVPLLNPRTPLVGTGLEEKVARDSGAVVIARRAGVVTRVTADEIIVDAGPARSARKADDDRPLARLTQQDRYRLKKYWRTNQDTAINQRPIVRLGQKVKAGDVLADGAATEHGPAGARRERDRWRSCRGTATTSKTPSCSPSALVKDDVYSSIHIQELELHVRDTKRGQEEITREIPNVAEESLVDLDERGIVRIGAHVKPGDILVGKITPKGETELSPEEKLLTAIFGEKAKDVKDSSLKVPPGMEGVVIDVKIFSRIEDQVVEKDRGERIGEVRRLEGEEKLRVNDVRDAELAELLDGQTVALALKAGTVEEAIPAGTKLTAALLREMKLSSTSTSRRSASRTRRRTSASAQIIDASNDEKAKIEEKAEERIDRILQPDELPPGVIQLVKVYLAEKRKVSVGDKMAGRHGNKGIVARVVPEEDMPFLPDGRPGGHRAQPARRAESHERRARSSRPTSGGQPSILGFYAKTPVFQGANEREIGLLLKLSGARVGARRAVAARAGARRSPMSTSSRFSSISSPIARRTRSTSTCCRSPRSTISVAATMSQETRDVFHRVRDFLAAAATELAEREQAEIANQMAYPRGGARGPDDAQEVGIEDGAQGAREASGPGTDRAAAAKRSCRRWPACSARSPKPTSTRRPWS